MNERCYETPKGTIHYWVGDPVPGAKTLVFLPGLSVDHRLFQKQIEYFEPLCNVLVWDAPGHAASRPFELDFSLADKARWLHDILAAEGIEHPILVGQSMGGYVSQAFIQHFPGEAAGFVCIDSAPLKREYMTAVEIWLLKRMTPVYRWYPHGSLMRTGVKGCSTTEYGRALMYSMWGIYDHAEFSELAGHGYRILAEAIDLDLPYDIDCPALLICGDKDAAGSTKRYNREWTKRAGLPLVWIEGAGHNSNTDRPEQVNALIADFAGI
ncbi:MAG: alpha/beta hydrolase [Coriobacteriales bacterium]|nr:alpha/beta hydrolase [Coriobacteriales bacterium]MBQ6585534.1 alpha/beta hydrolase [Coriobacteriales bacterium]